MSSYRAIPVIIIITCFLSSCLSEDKGRQDRSTTHSPVQKAAEPNGPDPGNAQDTPDVCIGEPVTAKLEVDKTFDIPTFNGNVGNIFTDITFLSGEQKLMVSHENGMGEFPVKNGTVTFTSPGFVAPCPGYDMQGFVEHTRGLVTALCRKKRVLSISSSSKRANDFALPDELTDVSGIAYTGEHYLVSDRQQAKIFRLGLDNKKQKALIISAIDCNGRKPESTAYFLGHVWAGFTTRITGFKQGKPFVHLDLDVNISGVTAAQDYVWCTGYRSPVIYRFRLKDITNNMFNGMKGHPH